MRKYFLIFLTLASCLFCFSQEDFDKRVRQEIDSLKKILPLLYGNERVDCLNSLVKAFLGHGELRARVDSSTPYAITASNEAVNLAYKFGIVKSLLNLGELQNVKVNIERKVGKLNNTDLIEIWEQYVRKAIITAQEIQNDSLLGDGFYMLSEIQGRKKEFTSQNESYKKALLYYQKAGDEAKEAELNTWLCLGHSGRGDFETGFQYCQRSIQLAQKNTSNPESNEWHNYIMQQSLVNMASLYVLAGDYDQAFFYLHQSRQFGIQKKTGWYMQSELGALYTKVGKFDSAFILLKDFTKDNPNAMWGKMLLGETYLAVNDFENALSLLHLFIDFMKKKNPTHSDVIRALMGLGKVYLGKKNYKKAALYAREGFELARNGNAKPYMMDGYKLLSSIFNQLGEHDKAYKYLLQYTELKDSILNRQFYWRLNNYKKEAEEEGKTSQINLLNKDNQLKEQKLKQQAFIKNSLIAGLILLILLGLFIFRNLTLKRKSALEKQRLESEKEQAELQQRATELEMQALRAQMNPHFIFNCLSSINKFILKNDTDTASDYLTRFSRLIRQSLTNSQLSLIPLSDEIEMLRLYLDMERIRFSESFNYNIVYENTIEPETIYIPPMLLQPFCENAIWHGLMHKEGGQGKLEIIMSLQNGELKCIIADNGVGREKAAEIKSTLRQAQGDKKQKSFGLKITTERLALFNDEKAVHSFYKTEDVLDSNARPDDPVGRGNVVGTKVTLNIKFKNSVQQPAKETV